MHSELAGAEADAYRENIQVMGRHLLEGGRTQPKFKAVPDWGSGYF